MPKEIRIGTIDDFEEGVIRTLTIESEEIAVVKSLGRFYAFSNQCPHWGLALSDGYINAAGQIACLYHGSVFNMATGAVVDGPADEDLWVFSLRIEGAALYVEVDGNRR